MLCTTRVRHFAKQFNFHPSLAWSISITRERFITSKPENPDDPVVIVPAAAQILSTIGDAAHFKPKLSACQVKDIVDPVRPTCDQFSDLRKELLINNVILRQACQEHVLSQCFSTLASQGMPDDIFPEARFQRITQRQSAEYIQTACRTIGTHIHIGLPDHNTALAIYNNVVEDFVELCCLSGAINKDHLRLYEDLGWYEPSPYASWCDFYEQSLANNFAANPRRCRSLVRLTVHGTIEFRVFPATRRLDRIVDWASHCCNLCRIYAH